MNDCIFCKIIAGEIPSHKVYEDDEVFAFLDIHPVNLGHTLVIPKEHHKDLLSTPTELAQKLIIAVQKITPAILGAVGSEGFNLGVNNGESAGQVVFHTHVHIMPRFSQDRHALWHGKEMSQDELKEVADKIKSNL
ncbi:MAG: HIT family protein [Parcubacteria group bacterium CG_4_9_14_0_2_um_filter_41_8]|nr:MAG: HIT family protein [Parcubacteria group bacterium CG22_combo_CG10-13_8_21_14_all_41_9]PJC41004.1 MAG: HIT family protein [Parcubacteria group bacterium CG_4_9_14_0_2_um_filter_41_8]